MFQHVLSNESAGQNVFHRAKYYVLFKRGVEDIKKDVMITIEKVFELDSLKILLSDEEEPSFLCVLTVTRADYADLKKQQGLLIDFDSFAAQLVRLLQQCAANNMFLILQQSNPLQLYLEFVEHNEFKRLVHLSLRTGPATDTDIKRHMTETIVSLKKSLTHLKGKHSASESMWSEKHLSLERRLHEVTLALTKMEEEQLRRDTEYQDAVKRERDRMAQERLEWQKSADVTYKNQALTMQETLSKKDRYIEEINSRCRQLQDTAQALEMQLSDKSQRYNTLEKDSQSAQVELANFGAKNAVLERDLHDKEKLVQQLRNRLVDCEKYLKEKSDALKECQDSIQTLKREKISLEERIALSESLSTKNNQAVQNTSEQLLKANQIISKQNCDLVELKEKLLTRTAIALEQEKIIEKSTGDILELKDKDAKSREELAKLKREVIELQSQAEEGAKLLQEKEEIIKNNNLVIQWLHKKLEGHYGDHHRPPRTLHTPHTVACSTPAMATATSHALHTGDDPIPNFYAVDDHSAVQSESPCPGVGAESAGRRGLDPRYLRPATDQRTSLLPNEGVLQENTGTTKSMVTSSTFPKRSGADKSNACKENKSANLPTVNYNDKKFSGRSVSYRPTPVSAYFPYKP